MSFRTRMEKNKSGRSLQKRHNAGTKKTGGGRFPTIFNKDKVPEGTEFWRCKEGKHLIDILPFEAGPNMPFDERLKPVTSEGNLDYVLDLFVHQNVGNMNKPFVCPYENFGEPCPICEFIKANRLDKEDWKKLVAKHRVVYLIWSHASKEDEAKGVQIFEASHFFTEEKIEEIAQLPRGGGFENFSHPDTGKSLAWTRKGSGMENTQMLGHRFVERESPIPNKILDATFPLDGIVNMHPEYDLIEKEFKGTLKKMNLLEDDGSDDVEEINDVDDVPFDNDEPKKEAKEEQEPEQRKRPAERKKRRRRR